MNAREGAWRLFAGELNASSLEKKGTDEKSPSYVITPLGAVVNRVLIAGVLTEKENTGSDEEPMWRGRVQDVSGNFFIQVGKFQPEAAASMADIEAPAFVAIVGKVKTYATDDGRVFVNVRPERIIEIDDDKRNLWVLEAAKSMWKRLVDLKKALQIPDVTANDLIGKGYSSQEAEGITSALDHYGFPESTRYLKLMQNALRMILPDEEIDFGLPEDISDMPDEIDEPKKDATSPGSSFTSGDKEDIILRILDELDVDPRGAPRDEIDRMAEMEGISADEVEEISSSLMDKGLVYEPNLGYLKKI